MAISQAIISTSPTTLFSSSGTNAITAIYLMNDHSNTVTLQIHIVPNGDSYDISNKIIKNLEIAAGDTFVIDTERLILNNGDSVQSAADVNAVCVSTISYVGV